MKFFLCDGKQSITRFKVDIKTMIFFGMKKFFRVGDAGWNFNDSKFSFKNPIFIIICRSPGPPRALFFLTFGFHSRPDFSNLLKKVLEEESWKVLEITRILIPRNFEFLRNLHLQFPPFWIQMVFMDDPCWEELHDVLQFSKHYHYAKFQVNISNRCRVLKAIPSE